MTTFRNLRPTIFSQATVILTIVNGALDIIVINTIPQLFVVENAAIGTVVSTITAHNPSLDMYGFNASILYSLVNSSTLPFSIDQRSGVISTIGAINYGTKAAYYFQVRAENARNLQIFSLQTINISVIDMNARTPIFDNSSYSASILESSQLNTFLVTLHATDLDFRDKTGLLYTLVTGTYSNLFSLNPSNGALTVAARLDRSFLPAMITLTATVNDTGYLPVSRQSQCTVFIFVLDVNDKPPTAVVDKSQILIRGDFLPGTVLANLMYSDADATLINQLSTFSIEGDVFHAFSLNSTANSTTARLVLVSQPNYIGPSFVVVRATNIINPYLSGTVNISLMFQPLNLFSPVPSQSSLQITVPEGTPIGSVLASVSATDADSFSLNYAMNATLSQVGVDNLPFALNMTQQGHSISIDILLTGFVDYEALPPPVFDLTLKIADNGSPQLSVSIPVTITALDDDTGPPVFSKSVYYFFVNDSSTVGTQIGQVRAEDAGDDEPTYYMQYFILGSTPFQIGINSGELLLNQPINYDVKTGYTFFVLALNTLSSPAQTTLASVNISVLQVAAVAPQFGANAYNCSVREDLSLGSTVTIVTAVDYGRILYPNAVVYSIGTGNSNNVFTINRNSGVIFLSASLNYSLASQYNLQIIATGQQISPLSSSVIVTVNVIRVNKFAAVFSQPSYRFQVIEQTPPGIIPNGTLLAVDPDPFLGDSVTYALVNSNYSNRFAIDPNTGVLSTQQYLDFSTQPHFYYLQVIANDNAKYRPLQSEVAVVIQIINITMPPPYFIQNISTITVNVTEQLPNGAFVAYLPAATKDLFDTLSYSILGDSADTFSIDNNGVVTCMSLDYQRSRSYFLTVRVTANVHQTYSEVTLIVLVVDINDNAPVFSQPVYDVSIVEQQNATQFLGLRITDVDAGINAMSAFSLVSNDFGLFSVDTVTGVVSVSTLNYQDSAQYLLVVRVQNIVPPFFSANATLNVTVIKIIRNAPVFDPVGVISVYENVTIGSTVFQVTARDPDLKYSKIRYYLTCCFDKFTVDSVYGNITTLASLDREAHLQGLNVSIMAVNVGFEAYNTTITVNIQLLDIGDYPPVFTEDIYNVTVLENTLYDNFLQVSAASLDTPKFSHITGYYFADNTGALSSTFKQFAIDSNGTLSIKRFLDHNKANFYVLAVVVIDAGALMGRALVHVDVTRIIYPPATFQVIIYIYIDITVNVSYVRRTHHPLKIPGTQSFFCLYNR